MVASQYPRPSCHVARPEALHRFEAGKISHSLCPRDDSKNPTHLILWDPYLCELGHKLLLILDFVEESLSGEPIESES